jgi:sugar lactone lactonase YvrE
MHSSVSRALPRAASRLFFAVAAAAAIVLGATARADSPAHQGQSSVPRSTTVVEFDATALEAPESVAIDSADNTYVSLALTGEIRKIAPDGAESTFARLPLGAPPLTFCDPETSQPALLGCLAFDFQDHLYAALDSCDPGSRGVWKLDPSGAATLLATVPMNALIDGIAYHHRQLYLADADLGIVWRVPAEGGAAEVWSDDPLLKPSPNHVFPGPNGIQVFEDEIYVSNSDQATVLAIPIGADGAAGAARIHASGVACDDFAFDVLGNLYCGTDPFDTLVRIRPDGSSQVLLTAADGLDGPTYAAFGRSFGDFFELYLTNAAFPFYSTTHHPSLMRVDIDIPGAPRPY